MAASPFTVIISQAVRKTLYRDVRESYKLVAIIFIATSYQDGANAAFAPGKSGVNNIGQIQFFRNLFDPLLNALGGQFRLAVFVDGQTDKVVVVCQAF